MTPDEIKSAITGWCGEGSGMQLVEDRSEPGTDFLLSLRVPARGSANTVPVEVRHDQGAHRVTVTSTSAAGDAEGLDHLIARRPASVRVESVGGSSVVTGHVYTDGFNRHTFLTTVEEVSTTAALVDGLGGGRAASAGAEETGAVRHGAVAASTLAETRREPQPEPQAQPQPWAAATPVSQPEPVSTLPAPSFGAAPTSQPSYTPLSGQTAVQAQPVAAAFAPTHSVPPQGMQAWTAPDPNGAVVATLGGGLPIQVTEVRGAWARVLCSNGWTGWVDGRIIGVAR